MPHRFVLDRLSILYAQSVEQNFYPPLIDILQDLETNVDIKYFRNPSIQQAMHRLVQRAILSFPQEKTLGLKACEMLKRFQQTNYQLAKQDNRGFFDFDISPVMKFMCDYKDDEEVFQTTFNMLYTLNEFSKASSSSVAPFLRCISSKMLEKKIDMTFVKQGLDMIEKWYRTCLGLPDCVSDILLKLLNTELADKILDIFNKMNNNITGYRLNEFRQNLEPLLDLIMQEKVQFEDPTSLCMVIFTIFKDDGFDCLHKTKMMSHVYNFVMNNNSAQKSMYDMLGRYAIKYGRLNFDLLGENAFEIFLYRSINIASTTLNTSHSTVLMLADMAICDPFVIKACEEVGFIKRITGMINIKCNSFYEQEIIETACMFLTRIAKAKLIPKGSEAITNVILGIENYINLLNKYAPSLDEFDKRFVTPFVAKAYANLLYEFVQTGMIEKREIMDKLSMKKTFQLMLDTDSFMGLALFVDSLHVMYTCNVLRDICVRDADDQALHRALNILHQVDEYYEKTLLLLVRTKRSYFTCFIKNRFCDLQIIHNIDIASINSGTAIE